MKKIDYLLAFLIVLMTDISYAQAQTSPWANAIEWAINHSLGKDRLLALRCLNHILAHDSTLARAHYAKAEIIKKWGWRRQAINHYNAALRHQPALAKDEWFMQNKYMAALNSKDYEEGHRAIDPLLQHYPLKVSYLEDKALLYHYQKNYDAAITFYDQAISIAPDKGKYYVYKGDMYRAKNTYAKKLSDQKQLLQAALKSYQIALTKNLGTSILYNTQTCQDNINSCQQKLQEIARQEQEQADYAAKIAVWTAKLNAQPRNFDYLYERAYLYEKTERYAEAKQDLVILLKDTSITPEVQYDLLDKKSSCERGLKQYDQAIATMNEAIALGVDSKDALLGRHYLYKNKGDFAKALVDINTLLKGYPNKGIFWGAKAEILFEMKRYAEAWQAYQKAKELGGFKAYVDEHVEACKLALGLVDNRKELIEEIHKRCSNYELDTTLALVEYFLKKYPQDAEAYFYRAEAYRLYDKYLPAIAAYEQALKLTPSYAQNEQWLEGKATMHQYARQYPQAIKLYQSIVLLNPKKATQCDIKIAEAHLALGNKQEAEISFGMALVAATNKNERGQAHHRRGQFMRDDARDFHTARAAFKRAIAQDYTWAQDDLAEVEEVIAHLDTVKMVTEQLKDKNVSNRADLLVKRAMGYYHSEQNDKAFADFEEAGKLKPTITNDLELGFYWGELALELKKYPQAIEIFEKTRQKHPKDEDVLACLGEAYRKKGDYTKAIEILDFFEKNSKDVNEYIEIFAERGKAKLGLKDYAGALKDFERHLLYDPYLEPTLAKEMKECREKLGGKK